MSLDVAIQRYVWHGQHHIAQINQPERVYDFIENKRVMRLKIAISIADSIGFYMGNTKRSLH
ncbi:hypothetical protein B2I21_19785 [Chryseobacterium mucoviscidosis]|nr:hypothetical protein B2I21_19785 [Chryseobacterium mucoviscidosis]